MLEKVSGFVTRVVNAGMTCMALVSGYAATLSAKDDTPEKGDNTPRATAEATNVKMPKATLILVGGGVTSKSYLEGRVAANNSDEGLEDGVVDPTGIMRHMLECCGKVCKKTPKIVVVSTASEPEEAEEVGERYARMFAKVAKQDPDNIDIIGAVTAENEKKQAEKIKKADYIFFVGGYQDRIITAFAPGRETHKAIMAALDNPECVISGSSAGVPIFSDVMVNGGGSDEPEIVLGKVAKGWGVFPKIIFDTHFGERVRLGRLMLLVDKNPGCLGLGLDERTGIIIKDGVAEVFGEGNAWLVGKNVKPTIAPERAYEYGAGLGEAAFKKGDYTVFKLKAGHSYDLVAHKELPPGLAHPSSKNGVGTPGNR